jgi:hypothetical protein
MQLQLNIFTFDETYASLQAFGSAVNLVPWFPDGNVSISHACFITGSEELLMVDTARQGRIFSFITQQFRSELQTNAIQILLFILLQTSLTEHEGDADRRPLLP